MNILLLTTHCNTGGITSYLLTLAQGLVQRGHKVMVASSGGDSVVDLQRAGVTHVMVNTRTKAEIHPKLFLVLPKLKRLVQEERMDVIHAHTRVTQVLGYWLSRQAHVPLVTTCHGFFKPRWFRKIFPCWGEAVIAISRGVVEHLRRDFGVADERIHLIPNGVDLNRFVPISDQERQGRRRQWGVADGPVIGIIARLSDVKGIDVLIKAMPAVIKEFPTAQLMVVGQGPQEKYLRGMVEEMALTPHVRFERIVKAASDVLPVFDVFVMPSLMEGLGIAVMEAQACGIVVVASNAGGLPDLIEDGLSGHLVPVGDAQILAQRIITVLKNPAQSKAMAKAGRARIEQKFSAARMVEKTLRIYGSTSSPWGIK